MLSQRAHNLEFISRFLLLLMWAYAFSVKLMNPSLTQTQLDNQVFTKSFSHTLFYLIPILETSVLLLLLFKYSRRFGYLASGILLSLFTGYILLVKLSYFGRIPCSCGGIISGFSWTQHLLFNCLFLILSMIGFLLMTKERRIDGQAP